MDTEFLTAPRVYLAQDDVDGLTYLYTHQPAESGGGSGPLGCASIETGGPGKMDGLPELIAAILLLIVARFAFVRRDY